MGSHQPPFPGALEAAEAGDRAQRMGKEGGKQEGEEEEGEEEEEFLGVVNPFRSRQARHGHVTHSTRRP